MAIFFRRHRRHGAHWVILWNIAHTLQHWRNIESMTAQSVIPPKDPAQLGKASDRFSKKCLESVLLISQMDDIPLLVTVLLIHINCSRLLIMQTIQYSVIRNESFPL